MGKKLPFKISTLIVALFSAVSASFSALPAHATLLDENGQTYYDLEEVYNLLSEIEAEAVEHCGGYGSCAENYLTQSLEIDDEYHAALKKVVYYYRFSIILFDLENSTLSFSYRHKNTYSTFQGNEEDSALISEFYVVWIDADTTTPSEYYDGIWYDEEKEQYENAPYFVLRHRETGEVMDGMHFLVDIRGDGENVMVAPDQEVFFDFSSVKPELTKRGQIRIYYHSLSGGSSYEQFFPEGCWEAFNAGIGCRAWFNGEDRRYFATREVPSEDHNINQETPTPNITGTTQTDGSIINNYNYITNDNSVSYITNDNATRYITHDNATHNIDNTVNNIDNTVNDHTVNNTDSSTTTSDNRVTNNYTTTNTTNTSHATSTSNTYGFDQNQTTAPETTERPATELESVSVPIVGDAGNQQATDFVWWFIAFAGISTLGNTALVIALLFNKRK